MSLRTEGLSLAAENTVESILPLVLESFTAGRSSGWGFSPGRIAGWAFDPDHMATRLHVEVRLHGALIATAVACDYRPDLADNNVGDGKYGFEMAVEFDLDVGMVAQFEALEFIARNLKTEQDFQGTLSEHCAAEVAAVHAERDSSAITVFGNAFFIDHIHQFNGGFDGLKGYHLAPARPYLIVKKLQAFGDSVWYREEDGERTPTAAYPLAQFGGCVRELVKAGKARIAFDMSNEGQPFTYMPFWLSLFHEALDEAGIPASGCTLITQNRLMPVIYSRWCDETGRAERFSFQCYDYFIRRLVGLRAQDFGEAVLVPAVADFFAGVPRLREKHFLCMNFTPRPHRVAFLSWLFGRGLDAAGFISFAGFNMSKMQAGESPLPDNWLSSPTLERGFEILKSRGRMSLDLPADLGDYTPEFDIGDPECYRQSYFSIVTESDVSDGDLMRITEKVIKPMAMFHPIIVVGNSGSLQLLRDFGFRTFAPFIDESYDRVDDSQQRLALVAAEIERLTAMSPKEMSDWLRGLSDIVIHNYLHLHRGLNDRYRFEIEPRLILDLSSGAHALGGYSAPGGPKAGKGRRSWVSDMLKALDPRRLLRSPRAT